MENLLNQGFELAIFGMGTVFVFLALLVVATKTMSSLILRFEPKMVLNPAGTVTQSLSDVDQERLVAVISAAISQHRNANR